MNPARPHPTLHAAPSRTLLVRPARLVALAGLLAAFHGAPARADAPCVVDAEKVCPGMRAGDGRLWNCLLRNEFKLSSACVQNLREVQRRSNEFSADCASDVYRFCQGTPAGGGRILACLSPYVGRRELATNCEQAVVTALEKLDEFASACTDDAAALCQGVQPGGGRVFLCLRYQSEKLSSRCRKVVSK